jgi:hypothetical protein
LFADHKQAQLKVVINGWLDPKKFKKLYESSWRVDLPATMMNFTIDLLALHNLVDPHFFEIFCPNFLK